MESDQRDPGRGPGPRVQERAARRRRHRPRGRARRDLRVPGPERRREVDHGPHADHAPPAHRGHRDGSRATTSSARGRRSATRSASRSRTPRSTCCSRGASTCGSRAGSTASRRRDQAARRRAARARRARRGRRPAGRRLLGRHEAPARPGAGADPRPAHPVPRRADHRPRHAEPRRPLGRGRPPRPQQGVTVFLTTQYLEEADALADRVGIIDHGRIVAEGTPAELKAEIGRPTVEAVPADGDQVERLEAVLARLRRAAPGDRGAAAVRLADGTEELADIVRGTRQRGDQGRRPEAPRPEPRRRLPRQDRPLAGGRRRRAGAEEEHRRARPRARCRRRGDRHVERDRDSRLSARRRATWRGDR